MSVFQLLYVSGAVRPIGDEEIAQILAVSRTTNERLGVTGMLLAGDGAFVQVLEGEEVVVRGLAERISRDPRHRNFMVLVELAAAERAFANWQMGFRRLDRERAGDHAVFEISRRALAARISDRDGGVLLGAVTAFGRDFMTA